MTALTEEGLSPFRLLEPISSLALTPFAAKAASRASTVGELAALVFERDKECMGMGQGHLEEIRRKIEEFIGRPPYGPQPHLDIASLLRLALLPLSGLDRAILAYRCQLQTIAGISPQEGKEVEMAFLRDRDGKFAHALDAARQKTAVLPLLEQVFVGLVRPWMVRQGGVAHEQEIRQFCFEKTVDADYRIFERIEGLLEHILEVPFLFAPFLCRAQSGLWTVSAKEQANVAGIIEDAKTLIQVKREKASLKELARALARCRAAEWEECTPPIVERILFWSFTPSGRPAGF